MGNVLKPLWESCPAVTRLLLVTYPALSLGLTAVEAATNAPIHELFGCSAWAVVWKLRVWTPLLSVLYRPFAGGMSFLMTLMEVYMGMAHFPQRERELGSVAFMAWALLANAASNILYVLVMLALSVIDARYFFMPNMGMFELIMVIMSMQVLSDPGGSTNFWGIMVIPNKWYPLAFVGIFSFMNMTIMWNLLAAVAVGYVGLKYPSLQLDRLLPSQTLFKRIESSCCSSRSAILGGWWVPAGGFSLPGAGGAGSPSPSMFGSGSTGRSQETQMSSWSSAASAPAKFTAFSGQGQRLGDGSEDSRPNPWRQPPAAAAARGSSAEQSGAGRADASQDLDATLRGCEEDRAALTTELNVSRMQTYDLEVRSQKLVECCDSVPMCNLCRMRR